MNTGCLFAAPTLGSNLNNTSRNYEEVTALWPQPDIDGSSGGGHGILLATCGCPILPSNSCERSGYNVYNALEMV